jgi:hypothetical protein
MRDPEPFEVEAALEAERHIAGVETTDWDRAWAIAHAVVNAAEKRADEQARTAERPS